MIANKIKGSIIVLSFLVLIGVLGAVVYYKFSIIDFTYLLFIIGCFFRYIYIKTHDEQ